MSHGGGGRLSSATASSPLGVKSADVSRGPSVQLSTEANSLAASHLNRTAAACMCSNEAFVQVLVFAYLQGLPVFHLNLNATLGLTGES